MAKIVSSNKCFDASTDRKRFQLLIGRCSLPIAHCQLSIAHCLLLIACLVLPILLPAQYRLQIKAVDKDSAFIYTTLKLDSNFKNQELAQAYVNKLPDLLQSKGYPAASVDTVFYETNKAVCSLYVGETFQWAYLRV